MNELDKVSEKILKQIIKYDSSLSPENFLKIRQLKKFSPDEITSCLSNLEKLGFLKLNGDKDLLIITFKGKQYFLLKRKANLKLLFCNFLLPLVIALVTAYFTAKITTNNELTILIKNI